MDGTLKCCINVKFLKWKTAVFLCKGMSLFFKTHAVKIETKIYDVNIFKQFRDAKSNYIPVHVCVCVLHREREVSKRIFVSFFQLFIKHETISKSKVFFLNNQKPLIHSLCSKTFFPPYLKALHHQILMAHTETVV